MMRRSTRLPSEFPVGTKFVIEGRPAGDGQVQVFRRYIEFPDGRYLRLPARPDKHEAAAPAPRKRAVAATRSPKAVVATRAAKAARKVHRPLTELRLAAR